MKVYCDFSPGAFSYLILGGSLIPLETANDGTEHLGLNFKYQVYLVFVNLCFCLTEKIYTTGYKFQFRYFKKLKNFILRKRHFLAYRERTGRRNGNAFWLR